MIKKVIILTSLIFATIGLVKAEDNCPIVFPKTNSCAKLEWIYGPYLDQYNSAKISYSSNSQISKIKIIPWMVMSSHEHGSRPVVLTQTGDKEFLIEKAYFMGGMDGSWFFKIQLLDSNNIVLEEVRTLIEFKK